MEKKRGFEIAKGFENMGINIPVRLEGLNTFPNHLFTLRAIRQKSFPTCFRIYSTTPSITDRSWSSTIWIKTSLASELPNVSFLSVFL